MNTTDQTRQSKFQARKEEVRQAYEELAPVRERWIEKNKYYYRELLRLIEFYIEPGSDILHIGSGSGFLLSRLPGKYKTGIDLSPSMVAVARRLYPDIDFRIGDAEDLPGLDREFDYILMINVVGDIVDVQEAFNNLKKYCRPDTRILIVYYNYLWEPAVKLATKLGLRIKEPTQNWLSVSDIENLLFLTGFETVKKDDYFLFPKKIPLFSFLANRLAGRLPLLHRLCFLNLIMARPLLPPRHRESFSCSVIVPCKNERGNIENVLRRIPEMGRGTEIVFVDDLSTDGTGEEIKRVREKYPEKNVVLVEGPGRGKFEAVRAGFDRSRGDILMILDADATVLPEELSRFFEPLSRGQGEFINGCRLVYDMEKQAMRLLNIIGNKIFSLIFSYLLSRRIKDTLCGTKAFFRKDYLRMKRYFGYFGDYDRWGTSIFFLAPRN